jgi:uncharacterized protein (TIGR00297 family)
MSGPWEKQRWFAMQLIALALTHIGQGWWARTPWHFGVILAITAAFAALGHVVRGVTRSGAVAGAIVCFALFAGAGPGAFAALLSVFAVTWVATRLGFASKQRLGTAERGEGRTASQVLANIGVAAVCAVLSAALSEPLVLLAMAAALAEAAADTVSSECGQAFSEQARLITTFERVPAGTDGGVTPAGSVSGAVAAALISLICALGGLIPRHWWLVATTAGVLGMLADSYLGALCERRGWLGNDAVNFLSTLFAAVVATVSSRLLA